MFCLSATCVFSHLYSVRNFPPSVGETATRESLRQALKIWSDASSLTFREGASDVDIDITFATRYHDDGYEFDGKGRNVI